MLAFFIASIGIVQADQQVFTPSPTTLSVSPGATGIELMVSYDTTPSGLQTTGAGISIYFDSSKLTFVSLTALHQGDLLSVTSTPASISDDSSDGDGDEIEDDESASDWTERSIVFLRLYYQCEALEPKRLLQLIESCFEDLGLCRIPAISLIPCRGLCFADDQRSDDTVDNCGLYMLHCLLLET